MKPNGDDIDAYLDAALANSELDPTPAPDPSPEVSPSPGASPSASPSPDPSPSSDELVVLITAIHREQTATRVADTGSFYALTILVTLMVAAVLFMALRRKG